MFDLDFYILTHNRFDFLKQSLNSVINQKTSFNYRIIISDNSTNDETYNYFAQKYLCSNINYIRRNPPVSSSEHFNLVVEEASSKFVVLFHDDDIIDTNFIETLMSYITINNSAAVACNARVFKTVSSQFFPYYSFISLANIISFKNKKSFLKQYLPNSFGIAPFPSYLYNTKILKKTNISKISIGKHSDVALLSGLLDYGNIVWLNKALLNYRFHENNDSRTESIIDRYKLANLFSRHGIPRRNLPLLSFKFNYLSIWIMQSKDIPHHCIRINNLVRINNKILKLQILTGSFFIQYIIRVISYLFLKIFGRH